MRLALISDIHGNIEALQAVFADMANADINETVCIGDCIGYGADSEAVLVEVMGRRIPTTLGNHELAVCDKKHLNWFNPMARTSVEKTIATLSDASIDFIRGLPRSLVVEGCRCVHGYPPESVRTYLFQKAPHALIKTLKAMEESVCFVGHTHDLDFVSFDGRQVERHPLKKGITVLDVQNRYIVNVGSVGQPRDGNNNAKYAIYDTDLRQLEIRFVPYDIAAAVAKIQAAGLPQTHADRLW
ncbi:MAG: metallophosphoesterase family protein [Desulfobacteraceae bacterium]